MAKPRLGQHFLRDRRYLAPILAAADLTPSDGVIEVGPGKGALTRELVRRAGRVLALEVDPRYADGLHARLGHAGNLEVRLQDARRIDWSRTVDEVRAAGVRTVKLVANLPYYLATQMVIHALSAPGALSRLVVMVQDEVARRMCAEPGSRTYSAYTVAVRYYGVPDYVVKVPPAAFAPPPRVASAVVRIERRDAPPVRVPDPGVFFLLVQAMFTHRRKTLRRCLQGLRGMPAQPAWEAALHAAGLDGGRRPETLSLEELARLVRAVEPPGGARTILTKGKEPRDGRGG